MVAAVRERGAGQDLRRRSVLLVVFALLALCVAGTVRAEGGGTAAGVIRIRPEAPAMPPPAPPPARDVSSRDLLPPEGIAVGDRRLDGDDVALLEDFTAFLLDRPLTEAERRTLHAWIRRDFTADPEAFLGELLQLRGAWIQVEAVEDPVLRAVLRQQLIATFHFAFGGLPPERRPAPLVLVHAAYPPIAADAQRGILITERELDAFLAFDRFVAELVGRPPRFAGLDRGPMRAALRRALAEGEEWARAFPGLYPSWVGTRTEWARLGPAERAAFAERVRRDDPLADFPLASAGNGGAAVVETLEENADEIARGIAESVKPEDIPDEALEEFRRGLFGE